MLVAVGGLCRECVLQLGAMARHVILWMSIVFLAEGFSVFCSCCWGQKIISEVHQDPTVEDLTTEANRMLERIAPGDAGGMGSWHEVASVSQVFARGT